MKIGQNFEQWKKFARKLYECDRLRNCPPLRREDVNACSGRMQRKKWTEKNNGIMVDLINLHLGRNLRGKKNEAN
jgi:hypothetical protein